MNCDSDNYEGLFCADNDEYRVHCEICDKICIERYSENHLKTATHTDTNRKKQQSYSLN